jgi:AcrR family transcriptional regulator
MGISERKDREKQEMIELILDEAMKLIIAEGYDNITMRKIADKIEYSPTTIYLYFKDKSEILYSLLNMALFQILKKDYWLMVWLTLNSL